MSEFDKSRWARQSFSQGFREAADNFLPDRYKLIGIAKSLHEHFLSERSLSRVLDLGCGDGLLVYELMKDGARIEATLVDGSPEMLAAAKNRLADFERVQFVNASFQDLLAGDVLADKFDLIMSSFAIHHLTMDEKDALFRYVYELLNPGGFFSNIDVVAPPTQKLDGWYMRVWREWIGANAEGLEKERYLGIPKVYKENPDNQPDTLAAQLQSLEHAGFKNVDCYHKFGIFAMFGGSKEP
jgi:tRNA (cmo5U34)-methyltransferase